MNGIIYLDQMIDEIELYCVFLVGLVQVCQRLDHKFDHEMRPMVLADKQNIQTIDEFVYKFWLKFKLLLIEQFQNLNKIFQFKFACIL